MKLIVRSAYLEEMASLALTPDIKVITGVRRSGKSKLMEAFSERLKQADASANIIRINFNLTEVERLPRCGKKKNSNDIMLPGVFI